MSKKKVFLLVGHNSRDKGAHNAFASISEYDYNLELSDRVQKHILANVGKHVDVGRIFGFISNSNKHSMVNQAAKEFDVPLVVDMHLNAGAPHAEYHVVKYARNSKNGLLAAQCFSKNMSTGSFFGVSDPDIAVQPARWAGMVTHGCMATDRRPPKSQRGEDYAKNEWKYRGSEFLYNTNPPAILIEPFFISNDHSITMMLRDDKMDNLAQLIADAIIVYMFTSGVIQ